MRILVLGGTVFLGRHVVGEALMRAHEVTTFNRGTRPNPFEAVHELRGDRDGGLDALRTGAWDAVVDCCGFVPRLVGDAARLLASRIGTYVFVSSISVYEATGAPIDESSPLQQLAAPTEDIGDGAYGALKALSEQAAAEATDGRSLAVRSGLITGPYDPTGRFTYWPHRFARGGDVLVPVGPQYLTQWIDVRDLAGWIVDACEAGRTGVANVTGDPVPMARLVEACQTVTGTGTPVYVPEELLRAEAVGEWMELPLWIDTANPEYAALGGASIERARAAGLRLRPVEDTVRGALEHASPVEGVGLAPDREAAILARHRAG
jgi:2'-hydroxyisoflavone reductase